MEAKIRRRVALEEKAFRLVERLLDNPVTEELLLEAVCGLPDFAVASL